MIKIMNCKKREENFRVIFAHSSLKCAKTEKKAHYFNTIL